MGALLLMLMLFGGWLLLSALMDWDWCLGPIDLGPAAVLLGDELVRWIIGTSGALLLLFSGCSR